MRHVYHIFHQHKPLVHHSEAPSGTVRTVHKALVHHSEAPSGTVRAVPVW
jgi:hypothetical protein